MIVGIIDTGICNTRSLQTALGKLGVVCEIIKSGSNSQKFDKLVLPGVGAFDFAVDNLHKRNLWDFINKSVIKEKTPFLGICLGMQLLAETSEEGKLNGLGFIPGRVKRIKPNCVTGFKVPNVGWSYTEPVSEYFISSYKDEVKLPRFYYVHSYHFDCNNPNHVAMQVQLDRAYCAAVRSNHIWGAQFHPEKSHNYGLKFLQLWLDSK